MRCVEVYPSLDEVKISVLTAVLGLVRPVLTVLLSVTLPQPGDTAVVGDPTAELTPGAVGHTGSVVRGEQEVLRAGAGVGGTSGGDQTQVGTAAVSRATRVDTWPREEEFEN